MRIKKSESVREGGRKRERGKTLRMEEKDKKKEKVERDLGEKTSRIEKEKDNCKLANLNAVRRGLSEKEKER